MCDYPVIYQTINRVARKQHMCFECYETIEIGELYIVNKQLDRGEGWFTCKICLRCWELWAKVTGYYNDHECLEWGKLREAYSELREPLLFDGLVPLKWFAKALEGNRYRNKYYGEPLWKESA